MSVKLSYKIGDKCWISLGTPKLSAGQVVATMTLPNHPTEFYVIEPEDTLWPHLEIRDALLMSPAADQPLTMWTAREQKANVDGLN